jgi:SdpC family antimicrobial peptide
MFFNATIAVTLAATVATAGAPPASSAGMNESRPAVMASSTSTTAPSALGHSVVDTLFFLQGPKVRDFLHYAGVSGYSEEEISALLEATNSDESRAVVRTVKRELAESDPDYFADLGEVVASGTPVAVQRALEKAYTAVLATRTMTEAVQGSETVGYVPGDIGSTCLVTVVVALGAAIAVTAVAVLNYALAANIAVGFNVAAGTNVAYQVNQVKTKSKSAGTPSRFSAPVVGAAISVLRG